MHVDDASLAAVRAVLRDHLPANTAVFAYGSRANGRNLKPFSDLDLCLKASEPLPLELPGQLRAAFDDSDLPFRVDCVDWYCLSDEFRAAI